MFSPFVELQLGKQLDPRVLAAVRAVDRDRLRADMLSAGLFEDAVAGASSRFDEIRESGRITGRNWPGIIENVDAQPLTLPP
jgi:hypothetical protein